MLIPRTPCYLRINQGASTKDKIRMHQACKKYMSESHECLTCPFCLNQCIHAEPGKTQCPVCNATFEIDDRVECVFAYTENIRLPVNGVVCGSCGLVQGDNRKSCLYCGTGINTAVH